MLHFELFNQDFAQARTVWWEACREESVSHHTREPSEGDTLSIILQDERASTNQFLHSGFCNKKKKRYWRPVQKESDD